MSERLCPNREDKRRIKRKRLQRPTMTSERMWETRVMGLKCDEVGRGGSGIYKHQQPTGEGVETIYSGAGQGVACARGSPEQAINRCDESRFIAIPGGRRTAAGWHCSSEKTSDYPRLFFSLDPRVEPW